MWSKLPRLALALFLVAGVASGAIYLWKTQFSEPAQIVPFAQGPSAAAESLIEKSARQIDQSPILQANIQQRGVILDKAFEGSGVYWQLSLEQQKLAKLTVNIQVGKQRFSLIQVNDGAKFWTRESWINREKEEEVTLKQVDLQKLVSTDLAAVHSPATSHWMIEGGLPQLLNSLVSHFDFGEPRATEVGGAEVWILEGVWKRSALAELLPAKAEAIAAGEEITLDDLPEQLPDRVRLVLARNGSPDLFPYVVEYYRGVETVRLQQKQVRRKTLLQMVIRPVARPKSLGPQDFRMRVDEQEVTDVTDEFIARLQAEAETTTR